MTYNQKGYITDAMSGFVMQETTFPFVAIVMDDASTDGEEVVIERYMEENFWCAEESCKRWETDEANWLFAQHRENANCYFVVSLLKKNLFKQKWIKPFLIKEWEEKSKYIALCEGDDYWTDPYKLQKQVDYMESHEKCVCCAHNSLEYNTSQNALSLFVKQRVEQCDFTLTEFIKKCWFTPTQSLLYRRETLTASNSNKMYMHGDYSTLMRLLLYPDSYLHYDNQVMSVYRSGGYASTHYDETKLCDDFIELYEDIKEQSNHVCDDVFDQLIENQKKEKVYLAEYQKDLNKSRSPFVRVMHFICRKIAGISNLYFDCLRVVKKVEKKGISPLEKLS